MFGQSVLSQTAMSMTKANLEETGRQRQWAYKLFSRQRRRGSLVRMWNMLTGQNVQLHGLHEHISSTAESQGAGGLRTINLQQITGSEGRADDFDAAFCPLQSHTRDRWVSVATAMLTGVPLPPVELLQIGQEYFVRDGHHRISVARALGQKAIDAIVTVPNS